MNRIISISNNVTNRTESERDAEGGDSDWSHNKVAILEGVAGSHLCFLFLFHIAAHPNRSYLRLS